MSGKAGTRRAGWRARRTVDVSEPETAAAAPDLSVEHAPQEAAAAEAPRPRGSANEFLRKNARALAAAALFIVGVVLVILGWYGAAYTNIFTEQIPYLISGGLLGVALIVVAGFLASSASLERSNEDLRRDFSRAISTLSTGAASNGNGMSASPDGGKVFVVAGGHSYHEAGCPIVEGKDSSPLSIRKAIDSGYVTCKLCGD